MRKKLLYLFSVLLILTLLIAACQPKAEEPTEAPVEEEAEEVEEEAAPEEEEAAPEEEEEMEEEEMAPEVDCMGSTGGEVSLLGVWSGDEEARILEIFAPLTETCGITIAYEGTRDLAALLATRVEGGDPPDITMMPSIGSFTTYKDSIVPLKEAGAHLENYDASWLSYTTVDGEVLGVFVKTDIKSIVWYSPLEFEAAGYSVPKTWDEFVALADQIKSDGGIPFSMGMGSGAATGWTGTDFVQDILLRTQDVGFVNGIAVGDTSWTDPGVKEAWEIYGKWAMDETYALGGALGTVGTGFLEAIHAVFSDPPQAYMVKQSGFGGGVVMGQYPELEFGTDFDFFVIPGDAPMQVGGDALAVFNNSAEVQAIVAYLTSEMGANAWAASGFDLSPNMKVDPAVYADPISQAKAAALAAAPGANFDIGDLLMGGMNMDEFVGLTEYVSGGDLDNILARMQDRAEEVIEGIGAIECMGSEGGEVSLLGVWSGDEEARILEIFAPLTEACGITIAYEGTRDLAALLATRVEGGDPPDVTMMPGLGSFTTYKDDLIPLADLGAHLENYDASWLSYTTVDGEVLGVFVKTDIKSIAWYSPVEFDAAGYSVPTTWEEFTALVDQIKDDGGVPFSMGMGSGAATGWTGTDFVQDILLRTQGDEFTNGIGIGETLWTDPGVKEAWEIYGMWAMDETYALGGALGTVGTGFLEAIHAVFSDPPQAYMVKQSGFGGGVVQGQYPELVFGTDFDFFLLPGMGGEKVPMQVGGDALGAFVDTPEVRAVVAYLTSGRGGRAWAASGFDLSPNNKVTGLSYTDPISAKKANVLLQAAGVSFDYGDVLLGGMNMDEFAALTEYVNGGDLDAILARLQDRADEVFGP
jgi:alpha-glucoside transport system substrate-binding protein